MTGEFMEHIKSLKKGEIAEENETCYMEEEMDDYGKKDWFDKALAYRAVFGHGYGYGGGGHCGGGYDGGPYAGHPCHNTSIRDEETLHNLKTPTTADLKATEDNVNVAIKGTEGRINDLQRDMNEAISRNLDAIRAVQLQEQQNACDSRLEQQKCCCETKERILENRHETQLGFNQVHQSICNQTAQLTAQMSADKQSILDTVNSQEVARLNSQLTDAKAALSNANQTTNIQNAINTAVSSVVSQVANQCCPSPCPCPSGNGCNGRSGGN